MSQKIMLIDGNSIVNRAFYAIPVLTNSAGEFTNGIYGFLNILFKLLDEEKPDYAAVAFDLPKPTFRHEKFDGYKATRKPMPDELCPQLPLLKGMLGKMNIKIYEMAGYEADDILGTLARQCDASGLRTVVVSGDRDLLQLCTDTIQVRIPKTKGGKTEVENYYAQDVLDKIGVTPAEFIDMKALMGDASDNIPGVPGIGEKTALKIIQTYKNIETAIAHAHEVKPKKAAENLVAFRDQAVLSKALATIFVSVPLVFDLAETSASHIFNADALAEVQRLNFKSFLPRFAGVAGTAKALPASDDPQLSFFNLPPPAPGLCPQDFEAAIAQYATRALAAFHFTFFKTAVTGVSLYSPEDGVTAMPVTDDFDAARLIRCLAPFFQSGTKKITDDSKKAQTLARKHGLAISHIIFDVGLAAYVLDSSAGREAYAQADTIFAGYLDMDKRLTETGQRALYDGMEMPLVPVLLAMEAQGVKINKAELVAYGEKLDVELATLSAAITALAGEMFNINSPAQLGVILFEKLGLKGSKKTKTGYSTAADVLEKLRHKHEIIPKILSYRTYMKLKSTYVDGLLAQINPGTGKIHTTFNQTVTTTGRLSSNEPNLQNIPVRLPLGRELRQVFVPESDDFVFLDADYNQIELRVLAHLSGDETLIRGFTEGQDIHRLTASQVFNTPYDHVTDSQRSAAKAVNFGIVYGIGAFSLSEDLHISRKEAEMYINGYFAKYPKVKKFMDDTVANAREKGYAETIFARRRYLTELS